MKFDPEKVTVFGRTDARGQNVQFGIKAKDRQRHVYVIGKTGMGKSTLLENMAAQDLMNGEGMAFIDPHGSTAETLLNYIPEHRINDVLYFAPFDTDHPVSFNIMEDVGADKRHLVVSGLMSVFKKIWVDAWSARMEYILANTLLALLEHPGSTLLGVNRMLSDDDYRATVIHSVKDPAVKAFWTDEFLKYNERYMQEAGDAIKNKIGQFASNPIIRNIVGQPHSSFDIREMMDNKKILIMNLSKGLIGESNANLLGSMLTTRIYLAAMSRADLPPEQMKEMPNFYFFVDEFQSFANATFANILSEARKYHLNLTIAHQYIAQMEEEVRDAVFGNVGTTITFRVGPFDAEVLEPIFTPQFTAEDLVNLSFTQIYLTLMIDGVGSQPFSASTLPPLDPPLNSNRELAIAASRAQFAGTRAEVEKAIDEFHKPVVVSPDIPNEYWPGQKKNPNNKAKNLKEQNNHQNGNREGGHQNNNSQRPPRDTMRQERPPREEFGNGNNHQGVNNKPPKKNNNHNGGNKNGNNQNNNKSSEDLKSILRGMVAKEQMEESKKKPENNNSNGLKDALASVAKQEPKQEPEPQVAPTPQKEEATAQSAPQQVEEKKNGTSPKELERMMRVTTSDKPPV